MFFHFHSLYPFFFVAHAGQQANLLCFNSGCRLGERWNAGDKSKQLVVILRLCSEASAHLLLIATVMLGILVNARIVCEIGLF